ncbi:hypothetical protein [Bacteroides sp.]|uniref:hypothetical protein n=1 Tax=Bacteroides sp. TaxID=29523 RepID=UPI00262BC7BB|nr:hypothetical protein [Bacteroides sp.]MDD3039602.1 hypothetical protein [Bacteroides sp.]
MVDQKITQTITIAASTTDVVTVPIEIGEDVKLLAVGYTYANNSIYRLYAGSMVFPSRTDQLGSIKDPYVFKIPPAIKSGKDIRLSITNNNTIATTYEVTFVIDAVRIIDISSAGGAIDRGTSDTFIMLPTYAQSVVPVGGTVDVSQTINSNLRYISVDVPEGVTVTIYRNSVSWYITSNEIGALEFPNGVYFNTIRVYASNPTSVAQRISIKLIFEG